MTTLKKPTIGDAMAMVHVYGAAGKNDPAVCNLARAYVALLQTVAGQTVQLKNARFSVERALERFAEWPGDEQ